MDARVQVSYFAGMLPALLLAAFVSSALAAGDSIDVPNVRALKLESKLWKEYGKLKDPMVPVIRASDLMKILEDSNLVLIDVRQASERKVSRLKHSMSTVEFAERFRKGIPKDKILVVYDTMGFRAAKYARELMAMGINPRNLEGGVLAWSHAGGEFFASDSSGNPARTWHVHVYDKERNFLHPDYKPTW